MSDQQLLHLLEKYLRNECTPEEKEALESWYEGFGSRYAVKEPDAAPRLELLYQNMVEQLREEGAWQDAPVRRLRSRWWMAAAAVVAAVVAGGAWWLLKPDPLTSALTRAGQRTQLTLPDGTRVWLNVSSKLEYARSMNHGERKVYLQGEAYFEVEQHANRPFVISTEAVSVQVLGTNFNLRAYPEDSTLETTLVEGKVAVLLNSDPQKQQQLRPGQKLTLTRKQQGADVRDGQQDWGVFSAGVEQVRPNAADSSLSETNWRNDRMQFKNKSFSELATIMERWYNKRIVIKDPALNANRFAGEFRNEDITEALKALQLTADFTYEIKGDTVYIQQ